jgi:toxin CptA
LSATLRVALRPSPVVAVAVGTIHAAALVGAALGLPPLAAGLAGAGIALSAVHHLRVVLHCSPQSVTGIEFGPAGRVALAAPDGAWREATLLGGVVPARWLAVVVARGADRRIRAMVVVPGSADAESFRRLRVWLRWRDPTLSRTA